MESISFDECLDHFEARIFRIKLRLEFEDLLPRHPEEFLLQWGDLARGQFERSRTKVTSAPSPWRIVVALPCHFPGRAPNHRHLLSTCFCAAGQPSGVRQIGIPLGRVWVSCAMFRR